MQKRLRGVPSPERACGRIAGWACGLRAWHPCASLFQACARAISCVLYPERVWSLSQYQQAKKTST